MRPSSFLLYIIRELNLRRLCDQSLLSIIFYHKKTIRQGGFVKNFHFFIIFFILKIKKRAKIIKNARKIAVKIGARLTSVVKNHII